jgi:hypothetical protein
MGTSHLYRAYIGESHVGDTELDFEGMPATLAKGFLVPTAAYEEFRLECAKTFYTGQMHLRVSIVRDDGAVPASGSIISIADPSLESGVDPSEIEVHVNAPTEDDMRQFCPFFRY